MKCYYDPTQEAVGSCKSCGKGLSSEYAVDVGQGLACKGQCEDHVRALNNFVNRNIATQEAGAQYIKGSASGSYGHAVFMLICGAIFAGTGLMQEGLQFTFVLGLAFIAYGVMQLIRARKAADIVSSFGQTSGEGE